MTQDWFFPRLYIVNHGDRNFIAATSERFNVSGNNTKHHEQGFHSSSIEEVKKVFTNARHIPVKYAGHDDMLPDDDVQKAIVRF